MSVSISVTAAGPTGWECQPDTIPESNSELLKSKRWADVTFVFENEGSTRIQAHRIILQSRSPVFQVLFDSSGPTAQEVRVQDASSHVFFKLLEFMYSDKFDITIDQALDLYCLAYKYKVYPLFKRCEDLLKAEMKPEHAVQVFQAASQYERDELMKKACDCVAKSLKELSPSAKILDVDEPTLLYLLEHSETDVDEVDLFKLALRWGERQLSRQNNSNLKAILKNAIPLIRYTWMTPEEFTVTVVPTNLLSFEEIVNVHSYMHGNDAIRKTAADLLPFNTSPRKRDLKNYKLSNSRGSFSSGGKSRGDSSGAGGGRMTEDWGSDPDPPEMALKCECWATEDVYDYWGDDFVDFGDTYMH